MDHKIYWTAPLLILLTLWIIVANIMIILARVRYKSLQKNSYLFISSLAAADLSSAFCFPAGWLIGHLEEIKKSWFAKVKSNPFCQTGWFLVVFPLGCSTLNLLVIACDRYIAILHPLKYKIIVTTKRCWIMIFIVWLVAIIVAAGNYIWYRQYEGGESLRCDNSDLHPLYFHLALALPYWVITITMFIIYIRIFFEVRSSFAFRQTATTVAQKAKLKMVFLAFGVFFICWSPHMVNQHFFVELLRPPIAWSVSEAFILMAYINSGLNFFIFACLSDKYRLAFKNILCCNKYIDISRNSTMAMSATRSSTVTDENE